MDDFYHQKTKKLKEQLKKEKPDASKILDSDSSNPLIQDAANRQNIKYKCSIIGIARYMSDRQGQKNKVVRAVLKKSSGGYPWYYHAKAAIVDSLLRGETTPLTEALILLDKIKPKNDKEANNIKKSIKAIKTFQSLSIPFNIKKRSKSVLGISSKTFVYQGVELKAGMHLVYSTSINGETQIGGLIINTSDSERLKSKQRKAVAYLLYEYLKNNTKAEYHVNPDLCICIDIHEAAYTTAPIGSNAPKKDISMAISEYKSHCDSY